MRYAAQIVFLQVSERKWRGNLLNREQAIDTAYAGRGQDGSNPVMRCIITQDADGDWCELMTQGEAVGSRRYSRHPSVSAAQNAAIKWCGRRFKIEVQDVA
jgi:hypothetical protein